MPLKHARGNPVKYDKDKIISFINETWATSKPGSQEWEAAETLAAMLANPNTKKEHRGKVFNADTITIDHPIFTIVYSYVSGYINYGKAVEKVMDVLQESTNGKGQIGTAKGLI